MQSYGVTVAGVIPQGLPSFKIPVVDFTRISELLSIALTLALVAFMEAISVSKAVDANHGDYEVDANQELIAVGLGNVFAGCFRGYPVSAGLSRSAVSDSAGAKTPICSIVNGIFVCGTLLVLSPLLSPIPKATLGAIIFVPSLVLLMERSL